MRRRQKAEPRELLPQEHRPTAGDATRNQHQIPAYGGKHIETLQLHRRPHRFVSLPCCHVCLPPPGSSHTWNVALHGLRALIRILVRLVDLVGPPGPAKDGDYCNACRGPAWTQVNSGPGKWLCAASTGLRRGPRAIAIRYDVPLESQPQIWRKLMRPRRHNCSPRPRLLMVCVFPEIVPSGIFRGSAR